MIVRYEIEDVATPFQAPMNITFGYQTEREKFSVWYNKADEEGPQQTYMVFGTGHPIPWEELCLVASIVMPDGFYVFHLVRRVISHA